MATSGRTAPPKIRLSTVVDIEPQIELQLDAPAKVGARVRVTVFDEDLFRTGDLSKDYNKVFSTFIGSLDPFMPAAVRDPAPRFDQEIVDPCSDFNNPASGATPAIIANCIAQGVPGDGSYVQLNAQLPVVTGGNDALDP